MNKCRVKNMNCPIHPNKCCCDCKKIEVCKTNKNLCAYVKHNMKFECPHKMN